MSFETESLTILKVFPFVVSIATDLSMEVFSLLFKDISVSDLTSTTSDFAFNFPGAGIFLLALSEMICFFLSFNAGLFKATESVFSLTSAAEPDLIADATASVAGISVSAFSAFFR